MTLTHLLNAFLFLAAVTGYCVLLLWALWPLLSSRDSAQYRRFILTDMYVLVLQIAIVGLWLRSRFPGDDQHFLRVFICCAFFLALIWRFIVAALDDHGIRGNFHRICVLIAAPIHGLVCPSLCFIGVMMLDDTTQPLLPPILLLGSALLPVLFRRIYLWARRSTKNAGHSASASSDNSLPPV